MNKRVLLLLVLAAANILFLVWFRVPAADPAAATPNLPRLQLVSDVGTPPPGLVAEPQPDVTVAVQSCVSLGPYSEESALTGAEQALRAAGYQPRSRTANWEVPDGWWAYVGNLAGPEERRRVLGAIRSAGIEDAGIPEPDVGNRVSVGVFTEQARADRRAETVRRLGFPTVVEEHRRPATLHWLDLEPIAGGTAQPPDVLKVQLAAHPGLELGPCGAPASAPAAAG